MRLQGSLQIGRAPDAPPEQAWALEDDWVSRRHALIEIESPGRAYIRDLGSRNGTLIDGRAVGPEPCQLNPGSIVSFGTHVAMFRFAAETDLEAMEQDFVTPFTPVATASPALARKT